MSRRLSAFLLFAALASLCSTLDAQASGSLMIWPLNPSIEAGRRAAALWLENVGSQPLVLQIRVHAWDQAEGADRYRAQTEIVGTPPFATLAPGVRQLVRLTALGPSAPGVERAYRILIDEITPMRAPAAEDASAVGVRFQMRYSLPLFVYGQTSNESASTPMRPGAYAPQLRWRYDESQGRPELWVRNTGSGHARLSQVQLVRPGMPAVQIASGLLGYVLPGAEMRWPLPAGASVASSELQVRLANGAQPVIITRQ